MKTHLLFAIAALTLTACGGSSSDRQAQPPEQPPTAPDNVSVQTDGADMTVSWSATEGATGYNIYYGTEPITSAVNYAAHEGGNWVQAENSPVIITAQDRSAVYHFAVTAQKANKNQRYQSVDQ